MFVRLSENGASETHPGTLNIIQCLLDCAIHSTYFHSMSWRPSEFVIRPCSDFRWTADGGVIVLSFPSMSGTISRTPQGWKPWLTWAIYPNQKPEIGYMTTGARDCSPLVQLPESLPSWLYIEWDSKNCISWASIFAQVANSNALTKFEVQRWTFRTFFSIENTSEHWIWGKLGKSAFGCNKKGLSEHPGKLQLST